MLQNNVSICIFKRELNRPAECDVTVALSIPMFHRKQAKDIICVMQLHDIHRNRVEKLFHCMK